MSTYICEKCGCIDNTACGGNYWVVKSKLSLFADEYSNTHLLCSECTPATYENGETTETEGKWHNRFPKRHWTKIGKENILRNSTEFTYCNAKEYFANCKEGTHK